MKIYTKVVIDMSSGAELESESYEYSGPMALCGGGSGGGGTTTVDYEYNSRMAGISEEQNKWAKEYFGMWQEHFKPYEIAQSQANLEMLPTETKLYKDQLTAATELLPQQTAAAQKFLAASSEGVDVNERMGLATADAANAWKGVEAESNRANARLGVNPNSGRFQGINAALDTQKASQLAGARTQARVGAEAENYDRLSKAASFNPTGGVLQGLGFMKG